jgi:hypothetical protein
MPTFDNIFDTIDQRFRTQFTLTGVDLLSDNVGKDPTAGVPFVRLTVLPGNGSQVEFGITRRFRRPGVASFQIFVPNGVGTGLATTIADTLKDIFEGRTVDGVIFRAADGPTRIGPSETWSQWNLNIPYQADELRGVS